MVTVSGVDHVEAVQLLEHRVLHGDVADVLEIEQSDVGSAVQVLEVHLGVVEVLISDLSEVHLHIVVSIKTTGYGSDGAVLHHELKTSWQDVFELELQSRDVFKADVSDGVLSVAQGRHVQDEVQRLTASQLDVGHRLEAGGGGEVLVLPDDLTEILLAGRLVVKALADALHLTGTETNFVHTSLSWWPPKVLTDLTRKLSPGVLRHSRLRDVAPLKLMIITNNRMRRGGDIVLVASHHMITVNVRRVTSHTALHWKCRRDIPFNFIVRLYFEKEMIDNFLLENVDKMIVQFK